MKVNIVRRWYTTLFGGRSLKGSKRAWWAGITEVLVAATVLLIGILVLITSITLAVLYSSPTSLYISVWTFALQLLVAISLITIGTYRVFATFWKVGASAERRGAIVSAAGEIEILNEIRRRREDLPTVPLDRAAPTQGRHLNFALASSRKNAWGFASAAALAVVFVGLATIVLLTAFARFGRGQSDWFAAGLTIPMCLAAGWTVYNFYRQLLKLTGLGPTSLEISDYPLVPGGEYQLALTQPGRLRLRLLDIHLVCQEEATFNQGTDVRTEQAIVYEHRIFRKRGVALNPDTPFQAKFGLTLPAGAMHSFKSENNRVQWKIVIHSQASGWPRLLRSFPISVHPPAVNGDEGSRTNQPTGAAPNDRGLPT